MLLSSLQEELAWLRVAAQGAGIERCRESLSSWCSGPQRAETSQRAGAEEGE